MNTALATLSNPKSAKHAGYGVGLPSEPAVPLNDREYSRLKLIDKGAIQAGELDHTMTYGHGYAHARGLAGANEDATGTQYSVFKHDGKFGVAPTDWVNEAWIRVAGNPNGGGEVEAWKYLAFIGHGNVTGKGYSDKKGILKWGKIIQPSGPVTDWVYESYSKYGHRNYEYPVTWYNYGELNEKQYRGNNLPQPVAVVTYEDVDRLMKRFDEEDRKQNPSSGRPPENNPIKGYYFIDTRLDHRGEVEGSLYTSRSPASYLTKRIKKGLPLERSDFSVLDNGGKVERFHEWARGRGFVEVPELARGQGEMRHGNPSKKLGIGRYYTQYVKSLFRDPPNSNGHFIGSGQGAMATFGTLSPVDVIQVGKNNRYLVQSAISGYPGWGWVNGEDLMGQREYERMTHPHRALPERNPAPVYVKIMGHTVKVGTKKHAILVQQKKHADDLLRSDAGMRRKNPVEYIELGGVCDDCVTAIVNDDYSGMDDEQEALTRAGIERIGHYLVVGEELGFSHHDCTVCGSGLGGNRHEVGYLEEGRSGKQNPKNKVYAVVDKLNRNHVLVTHTTKQAAERDNKFHNKNNALHENRFWIIEGSLDSSGQFVPTPGYWVDHWNVTEEEMTNKYIRDKVGKKPNPSKSDWGQAAFDAGKSAYSRRDATGVANSRVVEYSFSKWLSGLSPKMDMGGATKQYLLKSFREGWTAGKIVERRGNPESTSSEMYETFHGRPSQEIVEVEQDIHYHSNLAQLGTLTELKIATVNGKDVTLNMGGTNIQLSSNESGNQLYFVGGDQSLPLEGMELDSDEWMKDSMVIGVLYELTYRTEKGFDKFELTDYYHALGEETGVQPMLVYDTMNKAVSLVGGQYQVKDVGIVN